MEAFIITLQQGTVSFDASADNFGLQLIAAIEENDRLHQAVHEASLALEVKRADGFRDIVVGDIVRRKTLAATAAKDETFNAETETAFLTGPEISPERLRLHYERTVEVSPLKPETPGGIVIDQDADPYVALGLPANTN